MEREVRSVIQSIICTLFISVLFSAIFVGSSLGQGIANFTDQNIFKNINGTFNEAPQWRQLYENKNINQTAALDSNITLIGRWANGPCMAVGVVGNTAYFGNGGYLEIVDFENPANPQEISKVLLPSLVNGIAVSGNYVYVANYFDGLRIIDVSNPAAAAEVGFLDMGSYAEGVYVDGNYAYVANGSNGLRIIDVSNPAAPTQVGFINTGS